MSDISESAYDILTTRIEILETIISKIEERCESNPLGLASDIRLMCQFALSEDEDE